MRRLVLVTSVAACCWLAVSPARAQTAGPQDQPRKAPAGAPAKPSEANPFPEDSNSVPVISGSGRSGSPAPASEPAPAADAAPALLPQGDSDPVRSPEDSGAPAAATGDSSSSSSSAGVDDLIAPPPDTQGGKDAAPASANHQEGAREDEDIGSYYLGAKNWKAALSRYESALVLDPENPDVYWGLAEAERHMGNYASAKAHYQTVVAYDPDGRHARDARRILREPDLANIPASSMTKP